MGSGFNSGMWNGKALWISLFLGLLVLACGATQSANLLTNPGFETGDFQGWYKWGSVDGVYEGPWFAGIVPHSGRYFQGNAVNAGTRNGGIYQRVPATPGMEYVGRVWSCIYWFEGSAWNTRSRIGLDPNGGTDPAASSVVWSAWDTNPVEGGAPPWRQISVSATAAGNYITLFLEFRNDNVGGNQWHIHCFDDAELVEHFGSATSPPGWLRNGWNLISIPIIPEDPSPEAVFADLVAVGNYIENNLFNYDPGQGYGVYPRDFATVDIKEGYWLYLTNAVQNTCTGIFASEDQVIELARGWNLIGHPFDSPRYWGSCQITDGHYTYYIGYAPEDWIQKTLFYFDGEYKTVATDDSGDDDRIRPWYGYWVYAKRDGLSLIIPAEDVSPPTDFITAKDGKFWLHGEVFRFVGANLSGMVHYGQHDLFPYSYESDRYTNCNALRNGMHGRVARVFVASMYADPVEIGNRLQETIDVAAYYDIYLIVAFTDMYFTGMCPKGDEVFYVPSGGYTVLGHDFFAGGYTQNYLPLVQYLVDRFKDEPRIFAWELGNEIRDIGNPSTTILFFNAVHDAIKAIDTNHMVAVGTSSSMAGLSFGQAVDLYDDRFDFLVGHPYNGTDWEDDTDVASYVGKPFIVEEAGFSSDAFSDRPARTDADIYKWVITRGAQGYMHWGLMATPYDNGNGDRIFGIDKVFHAYDWDEYMQVYSYWGDYLAGGN